MYFLKPEFTHQSAVITFASKCLATGDDPAIVYGGDSYAKVIEEQGYTGWLKRVRQCAGAQEIDRETYIYPEQLLLIAESTGGQDSLGGSRDYTDMFPKLDNGDLLTGLMVLRPSIFRIDEAESHFCIVQNNEALLDFCLVPTLRALTNYMLVLQDALAHVVCAGLPYKYIHCTVPSSAEGTVIRTALQRCNFSDRGLTMVRNRVQCPVLTADLRMVQQLRTRIQTWQ